MGDQSIEIANRAVQTAERAVELASGSGDRMQLANACANLAQAHLVAKDLARAFDAAVRGGQIFQELLGPADSRGRGLLAMAAKLKEKIDSDYEQGIDWRRSFTCPHCGDRFPWGSNMDAAFEHGLDFLVTTCHTCKSEFRIEKPVSSSPWSR